MNTDRQAAEGGGSKSRAARRAALRRTNFLSMKRRGGRASISVLCECGESCGGWLQLDAGEYESVTTWSSYFVTPGHQDPVADRVVRERRSYLVVRSR